MLIIAPDKEKTHLSRESAVDQLFEVFASVDGLMYRFTWEDGKLQGPYELDIIDRVQLAFNKLLHNADDEEVLDVTIVSIQ